MKQEDEIDQHLLLLHLALTTSSKILDVLKSRYITGLFASSCRKARPLAAPSAIFTLAAHGRGKDPGTYNILVTEGDQTIK